MIRAMHKLIALQDKAMALTARLAVALAIVSEAPAAAIQPQVAVMPGSCRKQKLEKIRTSFSRRWTEPGSCRVVTELVVEAAMEVLAVVVEVVEAAGVAALAVRQPQGLGKAAAMFRASKHPDAGMTKAIEMIGVTERSAAKAPISRIQ